MFVLNVDISHNLGKFCPRDEAVLVFVEQLERRVRRTHHLHLKIISHFKLQEYQNNVHHIFIAD